MSVTFLLPSTQVRLLLRLRLLGPVFSAVLLLVSLTPSASLLASSLRCYARHSFCCREVCYAGYACCASTQVRLLFRLRLVFHFFSAALLLVSCTPLASLSASFAAQLCKVHLCCRITLLCRLRLLCLLPKYVCNSVHVSSVPSP